MKNKKWEQEVYKKELQTQDRRQYNYLAQQTSKTTKRKKIMK